LHLKRSIMLLLPGHRIRIPFVQSIKRLKRVLLKLFLSENFPKSEKHASCGIDDKIFTLVESDNESQASSEAVRLAKTGEADIVMKGLVGTDKFLKTVMDKKRD